MRFTWLIRFVFAAAVGVAASGCGGSGDGGGGESPQKKKGDNGDAKTKLLSYDAAKLPKVEPLVTASDEGRVLVSHPTGWVPHPATGVLAAFKDPKSRFVPVMEVRAIDAQGEADATADNVLVFAEKIANGVKNQPGIRGEVQPVRVGGFYGAYYEQAARQTIDGATLNLRVLRLVTIRKARRYTVDLKVVEGGQESYRNLALALAGGLDFSPKEEGVSPP